MDNKKIAAAIAAVYACIRTGEEAAAYAAAQAADTGQADAAQTMGAPARPFNTWGITGRQNQMQANTMMQMRMFK